MKTGMNIFNHTSMKASIFVNLYKQKKVKLILIKKDLILCYAFLTHKLEIGTKINKGKDCWKHIEN